MTLATRPLRAKMVLNEVLMLAVEGLESV